ncbi:carboxyl-terminal processing protease [Thermoanaerobacter thermohydrosulfuricus]|uniref:C-terminal processing peptidase n=4 Tax=Thermoanaerobacter TaxID=1754 RepID=I9KRR8_9THEO|nr:MULTISPECIES: S41 family peptidase [Thermoanaerobacter]EGD52676.1 carboxyl-terminal protease [Thermoanaerobacter ethanolicus JW 200]HHY79770.1 S41 family peptidase [Thermoanaerobacter sp.]AEM79326.1 carboxyl-terminal protease [Thermoanaerobacter wiegelii Rt8.B1]EIV99598.1 C-terminal processing peptidase [Thermoanaerobacter siderophilus SR4]EMT39132.1 C-terminal peptidase (prc) [Thermoanaerobacter thermohydrosulfuricus WC1]
MAKKRFYILLAVLLIVTNVITFMLANAVSVALPNGKVLVSREEYQLIEEYNKLFDIEKILENRYVDKVNSSVLLEGAMKGMANSLGDPYTVYMNKKEFSDFMTQTTGTYGGIGIVVAVDKEDHIVVVSPIKNTPGERAGIKSGDIIVEVNNTKVSGKNLDEAVAMMRGPQGTQVTLTIMREGKTFTKTITREIIKLETVYEEMLPDKIGYIKITMFDQSTSDDFKASLNRLKSQGMKGLIIDLRDNPGGLLEETIDISNLILPKGVVVTTKGRVDNKEYYSKGPGLGLPIAVLVNKGSASASEILAGAIKDRKVGILVGTTTFGKGLVQTVVDFGDGTGLKYTIARYYTPNGTNIQGKGIEPNYVVELPANYTLQDTPDLKRDTQLIKAFEIVKSEIK